MEFHNVICVYEPPNALTTVAYCNVHNVFYFIFYYYLLLGLS
uniref:Uncharacterized protein n=1 Tax=Anguilla anguilla TaxID=7936 RepID=A0A0E9UXC9_ANGAN